MTFRQVLSVILSVTCFAAASGQAMAQSCAATAPGMVSWWPADGNADDVTGSNNNGTLTNGASFAPGFIGQAFSFDGANDVITFNQAESLSVPSGGPLSMEAWVYRTSSAWPQHLAGKRQGCGGGTDFYQMAIGARAFPPDSVPLKQWTHLAVTYDGSVLSHYVNGTLVLAAPTQIAANTGSFVIGASGSCAPFAGRIDDFAFYSRALTGADIWTIFQAGAAGKCRNPRVSSLVNAAGYQEGHGAPDSIASIFGTELADQTPGTDPEPLATTLQGASVEITDSAGVTQTAPLFLALPSQINFLVPGNTALGQAQVRVIRSGGRSTTVPLQIDPVAPALFSANATGSGVAAALVQTMTGGSSSTQPAFRLDPTQGRLVSAPIHLDASAEVYLLLFGTGIRHHGSSVVALVGGQIVPVLGAIAQGEFPGLDQVNIGPLPAALAGRGDVDIMLFADGVQANTVTVNVR